MNALGKLLDEIAYHLARELGHRATATALARLLGEEALSWRMPEVAAAEITIILAFISYLRAAPRPEGQPYHCRTISEERCDAFSCFP
jgi:hypothetical protein